MRPSHLSLLALLAACGGLPENEFIPGYTTRLCDHTLACSDQAQLTFDGILTVEDCVVRKEAEVSAWGAGCKYHPPEASTCLEEMDTLACPPGEGQLAERPIACAAVYTDCGAEAVQGDDSDAQGG